MTGPEVDMAVHHALMRGLIERGRCPGNSELSRSLGLDPRELELSLSRLSASHSLVLHPERCEPWVIHPFSTSPTHTYVASAEHGWWAPCLWCALGITVLVGGELVIHSRLGGEAEPVAIPVADGQPSGPALCVHFPEPPRLAWSNVHHFCARLLPFRHPSEVAGWVERHGLPVGRVLPLEQLAELARRWYGGHARPDWKKLNPSEAAAIFRAVGLEGEFWRLEERAGSF